MSEPRDIPKETGKEFSEQQRKEKALFEIKLKLTQSNQINNIKEIFSEKLFVYPSVAVTLKFVQVAAVGVIVPTPYGHVAPWKKLLFE